MRSTRRGRRTWHHQRWTWLSTSGWLTGYLMVSFGNTVSPSIGTAGSPWSPHRDGPCRKSPLTVKCSSAAVRTLTCSWPTPRPVPCWIPRPHSPCRLPTVRPLPPALSGPRQSQISCLTSYPVGRPMGCSKKCLYFCRWTPICTSLMVGGMLQPKFSSMWSRFPHLLMICLSKFLLMTR